MDDIWVKLYDRDGPLGHKWPDSMLLFVLELELELIQTQMAQKPMLRAEVGMRVRCANKASAECIMRGRGVGKNSRKNCKLQKARHLWVARTPQKQ